jgi:hypothetical protein
MKSSSIILILMIICSSCNHKLVSGKYVYKSGNSYFEINKDGSYYYYSSMYNRWKFSQGKVLFDKNEIKFLPDSSFFFHISVSKYYLDPSINGRKIIIEVSDSILNKFQFSFNNGSSSSIINFEKKSVVYKPVLPSYQDGSITIKAVLVDSTIIIPLPLHNNITSNTIFFFDVNNNDSDDKPWNVLVLKVDINGKMFSFTTLPPYILKNKSLIEKNLPVYKLTK